jgi:hypothetical protein
MNSIQIGEIAMIFLSFRDQLKIYHWQTSVYARHVAADKLFDALEDQIDRFMEVLQGTRNLRIQLTAKSGNVKYSNQSDDDANAILLSFKNWLSTVLPNMLEDTNTDLLNIRDEMLASVNNTIYLYSFL